MFTSAVVGYIQHCNNTVTVDRSIRVLSNQKPCMNGEVKKLLRVRNSIIRSGDRDQYSCAQADLKRGTKVAKSDYKQMIKDDFISKKQLAGLERGPAHYQFQTQQHQRSYQGRCTSGGA